MAAPLDRPDLYVVTRILEALQRSGRPLRRTRLQQASGLNYTQLERYLAFLTARGLLATVDDGSGGVEVEMTARGQELLAFIARGLRELLGEGRTERRGERDQPA